MNHTYNPKIIKAKHEQEFFNIGRENMNPNLSLSPNNLQKKKIKLKGSGKGNRSFSRHEAVQRKNSLEQFRGEVTAFDDCNYATQPSVTIDLSISKQRKSMQDTMVGSDVCDSLVWDFCYNHKLKKATYMIEGKGYCDKCSVNLISKGFRGCKIGGANKRQKLLELFMEEIDQVQPQYQTVINKFHQQKTEILNHYQQQERQMETVWNQMMVELTAVQQKWKHSVQFHYECSIQQLEQQKQKLSVYMDNLTFMRNDIISNIEQIMDHDLISNEKFDNVLQGYQQELYNIRGSILNLPENVEPDQLLSSKDERLYQLVEEIKNFFSVTPKSQRVQELDLDSDSYRMSFGNQTERLCSPTFKVV